MSRRNVIDGLVGQIQLTNGFEPGNKGTAVAYDHRVLNMGVDRAAIVLADVMEQRRLVMGGLTEMTYGLELGLYIRHNNDVVAARQDADLYVANIVARINTNSTLGGSAFDAMVTSGRVEDENLKIGAIPFLCEILTVTAVEHLTNS